MNPRDDRAVRRWLVASALAVVLAVLVGGITRLTDSGLSITEWRPISGVFPPRSEAAWQAAYQRFQEIPQAQSTHRGISLENFQRIYWWEWVHRILARLVGLVLAVPYIVLLARGQIRPTLRGRLAWLPILAATQGILGWWMVSSGLTVRSSVSPVRLTVHLGVALIILLLCTWTALGLSPPREGADATTVPPRLVAALRGATALAFLTLLSGGLVAGLDAGLVYNTFPRMGSGIVPVEYSYLTSWPTAMISHPVIVQFHHRLLGMLTAVTLVAITAWSWREPVPRSVRRATTLTGIVVLVQVGLGIGTLLLRVPLVLAVLHQLTGLVVLMSVAGALQRASSLAGERRLRVP